MFLARYLGKRFGLGGKDENEAAIIDMYLKMLTIIFFSIILNKRIHKNQGMLIK